MTHPLPLHLALLGGLEITRDDVPVTGFVSSKAQALLCHLAVTGRPHFRPALAGLLWSEMPEADAATNLRKALSNLRHLAGSHLIITRETVAFNQESPYWLDVEAFAREIGDWILEIGHQPSPISNLQSPISDLQSAIDLYRGDFLEGFHVRDAPAFEEWVLAQRERLRELALQALHALAVHHTARGEYPEGMDCTRRLLALDPWREEAHRQLMLLLARSGQRSAALAQFDTCRRVLAEELGVEPAAETLRLYERIRSADRGFQNLPAPATPLIGRERELADVSQRLFDPACRLLTITGPGGIGKTRLALEAAARSARSGAFLSGVAFVPLAAVRSSDFLVSAIADACQLSFSGRKDPQFQLLAHLRDREMLLVLDSFEHVLKGSDLLTEILCRAPDVKLLVTSRERLNLQAEWVYPLEGLAYPDSRWQMAAKSPKGDGRWREVAEEADHRPSAINYQQFPAVQLLLECARRAPARAFGRDDMGAAVRICQLVEGTPLGIELAAAWTRLLSAPEIAQEIERSLDFLAGSLRDVPERQRSLRAVFDHSWQLLSEPERRVFSRLAIFRGGFRREAATRVAGASLLMLSSLIDKSLLRQDTAGRYGMHEFLRHYAEERLRQAPGEEQQARDLHCQYYAGFMAEKPKEAFGEVAQEIDNVRAAWQWAVTWRKVAETGKLLDPLRLFYEVRGLFREGEEAFAWACQHWGGKDEAVVRLTDEELQVLARLLSRRGILCIRLGLYREAEMFLQQSLALSRRIGDQPEVAGTLNILGNAAIYLGDYAEARQHYQESLALHRQMGHRVASAVPLNNLGYVALLVGDYPDARELLAESLVICQEADDRWGMAFALENLSEVARAEGRYDEARQLLQQSVTICDELGDRTVRALCLMALGGVSSALGELAEAQRLLLDSLAVFKEMGDQSNQGVALNSLGSVLLALDEPEQAGRRFQESMILAREIGDRRCLAGALNGLGQVAAAQGLSVHAEAWRHYAEALQTATGLAPLALDSVIGMAELLATEGDHYQDEERRAKAAQLIALALGHPATLHESKTRATRVLSALEQQLPPQVMAIAWQAASARPVVSEAEPFGLSLRAKPSLGEVVAELLAVAGKHGPV